MKIVELVRNWRAERRARSNRSGWDNPVTGADLLAAMVQADRRKREPLP